MDTKKEKDRVLVLVLMMLFAGLAAGPGFAVTIPGDTSVGNWDDVNRVYTLTTDVTETISVGESDLTLDGDGHSVTPASGTNGVSIFNKTNITVTNLNI